MKARGRVKIFDREIESWAQNPVEKSDANQDRHVLPNLFPDAHVGGTTRSAPTAQTTGRHVAMVGVRAGVWEVLQSRRASGQAGAVDGGVAVAQTDVQSGGRDGGGRLGAEPLLSIMTDFQWAVPCDPSALAKRGGATHFQSHRAVARRPGE